MTTPLHKQLLDVLKKIDRPGTFCTSGRLSATLPCLKVKGVGPVALPLGKRQAVTLRKQARQAPYGKGTQTLVDTDVRRVWEIDAKKVALTNPEWADVVEQTLRGVQADLGLEKQKLGAHLYKLLLYEPGSFFLPHRDGEKLDRMVATLVIALPSEHKGGELVVRHEGREETVEFSPQSRFHSQFAAFYADCEHEVRPIKSGFRLALVYNLTLAKSKRSITAPRSGQHIAAAVSILKQWKGKKAKEVGPETGRTSSKLAVLLEHEYSEKGLAYDALKGVDRAKAYVLFEAARQADCDAYLALATYWQSGSAESSDDDDYGYGRHSRRRRYQYDDYGDDDDGADEDGGSQHEMGEIFDESLSVAHLSDAEGNRLAVAQLPLHKPEIVSETPLGEGEPDAEEFEGFTGNAGMTLDRWYRHAAIVLWPADRRFDVLCEGGTEAAVGGLQQMVRQWKRARKSEQEGLRRPCVEFARRIIVQWPARKYAGRYPREDTEKDVLLPLLATLGETSLVAAWIGGVLAKDVSADPGKALGDACKQYGWSMFQPDLEVLFENTSNETMQRHAELLAGLALRTDKNAERLKLSAELAKRLIDAVERWNPSAKDRDWQAAMVQRDKLLPPLVRCLIALREDGLLDRLTTYILGRPKDFDLTTIQAPALLSLEKWLMHKVKRPCRPLGRWLTAVYQELKTRAANPPQAPANWRRDSTTGCTCADCKELSRFLNDPNTKTLRLPLHQHRRQHLHQVIDGKKLDTTHVTERRGRPYTLVCTKTQASHERAVKSHQVDLDHRKQIGNLLKWHEGLRKRTA